MGRTRFENQFRDNFLTGLAILGPVGLTLYISLWIIEKLGGIFTEILIFIPGLNQIPKFFLVLISTGIVIVLIYLTGLFAKNFVGRTVLKSLEAVIFKLPIIRSLYKSFRQFTDTLINNKVNFRSVVLIDFPLTGGKALAFVTNEKPVYLNGEKIYSIFVPTTPNPTSGFLIYLSEKKFERIKIDTETALKVIISGGVVISDNGREILKQGFGNE